MKRPLRATLLVSGIVGALALSSCTSDDSGSGDTLYGVPAVGLGASTTPAPSATPAGSAAPGGGGGPAPTTTPAPTPTATGTTNVPVEVGTNALSRRVLPKMGEIVTDAEGRTLYRFDRDRAAPTPVSNCAGSCAAVWPPVTTSGTPKLSGVDPDLVGTLTRPDGTKQVTIDGWPVYTYLGDKGKKVGAWTGQGVGNTWWVISPNGRKNLTCVPSVPPTPVDPPSGNSDY